MTSTPDKGRFPYYQNLKQFPTMSNNQSKLDQAIHSGETANEVSLERQIQALCEIEEDTPEKFEFVLSEKVFQLYYGEKGHLPTFKKEQQPTEIYFIQAIEKVDEHGNYRLTTNSFATSDHIKGELEKLELPC